MEIIKARKITTKLLERLVNEIKAGKVIICPTDTVYGLLTDATNKKAVEKLFKIKKRPKEKAIPIFVKNIKMAKRLAFIDKKQEGILMGKWPGKFTFVLERRKAKIFGVDKKTIALRIPNYKLVNLLLEKLNRPLTGTSANISGKPASVKLKEILKQFENHPPSLKLRRTKKNQPDLILDAGNLKKSKPSTIVDLIGSKLKILRTGDFKIK